MDAADAFPPPVHADPHPASRSLGRSRLRRVAWRGRDDVALLIPRGGTARPTVADITYAVDEASRSGVTRLVTGALGPTEQEPFLDAGFQVHDRLHLLRHELIDIPTPPALGIRVRRARRADHDPALAVDARAFDPFWRLDRGGLDDAIRATGAARFRVAADPDVIGYAVTGRSGERGYVQRLAVDPERRGHGLGTVLVIDALRWLRRRHAASAVVNTQVGNEAALRLYRRLGFMPEPAGLAVLTLPVDRSL